ncbi:MAG: hypothetical protein J7601_05710 [Chloroflexi bacterium]|jgi:hypothetical protein|nr:hypothetical protein [Chloroflexota bacterium]
MMGLPYEQRDERHPGRDERPSDVVLEKDWDQYELCDTCRGRADIEETEDGGLICRVCRAMLPRPAT